MSRSPLWAHRGATAPSAPENSLAAFARARVLGADGVELDARLGPDGRVLLSHDPLVGDVDGLATLDEALAACEGLTVNVELKDLPFEPGYATIDRLIAEVAKLVAGRAADVIVSSFHLPTLDAARALLPPEVRTGWLILPGADLAAVSSITAAAGHHAVHPHVSSVDAAGVAAAAELGLAVHVWTVNDPTAAARLAEWGVAALITDDIPALRV